VLFPGPLVADEGRHARHEVISFLMADSGPPSFFNLTRSNTSPR
jgi:hypothetical protein